MLRNDGKFEIYVLVAKTAGYKNFEWFDFSIDSVFDKIPKDLLRDGDPHLGKLRQPFRDFAASGECWQKTGVFGSFDYKNACEFARLAKEYCSDMYSFGVKKIVIEQSCDVVTMFL